MTLKIYQNLYDNDCVVELRKKVNGDLYYVERYTYKHTIRRLKKGDVERDINNKKLLELTEDVLSKRESVRKRGNYVFFSFKKDLELFPVSLIETSGDLISVSTNIKFYEGTKKLFLEKLCEFS